MTSDTRILARLRDDVKGTIIGPDDARYDDARSVYFTALDRRPAAVVHPADPADIVRAMEITRDAGLPLSVRCGGHSPAGHGVCHDGIVLDLSALRTLDIEAEGRTAWVGAGMTAGEYTAVTAQHGLVTGFGDAPSVGIGGITLAGGVGFLHRRFGLTIDNLLAAEIVTADGRTRLVDADSDADLFWAIRGGGGNFGVVTRLRFRLQPLDQVYGGMLILPATADTIVAAVEAALAAPDELSGLLNVAPAPPLPFIPPEAHGSPIIMAMMVHAGDAASGERSFAPFRALGPLADLVKPMRYAAIYDGAEHHPHPAAVTLRPLFIDGIDRPQAETILDALAASTAPMRVAQVRVLGGAVARVDDGETAFAHRGRGAMLNVAAMFEDPGQQAQHDAWADGLAERLRHGAGGAYIGFLGNVGAARVKAAYPPATWQRLRRIKAAVDPTNLFRSNQNIPPA
jgi:FAD/FMN-containing dehydrogenase